MKTTTELVKKDYESKEMETKPIIPAVDIFENENEIHLIADMPGVTKDTLSVNLEEDVLSVEGLIDFEVPKEATPIMVENISRKYARHFTLSHELNKSKIEASIKNGVLNLRIPKNETCKPKKIKVLSSE